MNARKQKLYELMHVLRHEYKGSYKWIAAVLGVPIRTIGYHLGPVNRRRSIERSAVMRARRGQAARACKRCGGLRHYTKTCTEPVSLSV